MEKIVVTNTAIIINDYHLGDNDRIEQTFSVWDPIKHKLEPFGMYYDEMDERLYLPRGIDLWWVRKCLDEKYYHRESHHKYKEINIQPKYKPRDEQQIKALQFMCGVNEYEENADIYQLSVNLNTGKGKTYCSIMTVCFYKIKSMIITASNSLLSQWKNEILHYTNLTDKDIVQIKGSDNINMILSGNSSKANNASIYLCSHGTLKSFGDTYGWDKVYELFRYLGIGLKFFDEAHTNFDNMLMIDYHTNVWRTYYVTATPGRSNFKENRIYQVSLKNVPSIDLFDERNDPHTDYIAIKYNSRPTPSDISKCKNQYGLDRMKYIDYITKNPEFYKMLRIIMELVIKCNGRVLFYIGTNEGILRVYHWIGTNYPEFLGDIGIFSSLVDNSQKLEEKKKKLLLSTTKSAGLGEHIEGLKMTILLAEPFKSEIVARQTLGRTRDDNTMYIELVDMGFKYIRKFYYNKLPIFNKYAKDVSDTTMETYEINKRVQDIISSRETWRVKPLQFDDKRFDFSDIEKKKEEPESNIIKPFEFINNSKYNNINTKF
jgi:hypothetical protein